jgi:hypothetical protein
LSDSDLAAVRISDIRHGMGRLLEEARGEAWAAMSQEGGVRGIPIDRFAGIIAKLADLDRGLAIIERRITATSP